MKKRPSIDSFRGALFGGIELNDSEASPVQPAPDGTITIKIKRPMFSEPLTGSNLKLTLPGGSPAAGEVLSATKTGGKTDLPIGEEYEIELKIKAD